MAAVLPDLFYYLENFRHVVTWVGSRHHDLLDNRERMLIEKFSALPQSAQALLVRMVMRKGELFRHSKLRYAEIGDIATPAALLAEQGLIDAQPSLSLADVFGLLRKEELQAVFAHALGQDKAATLKSARKDELLAQLQEKFPEAQPLDAWHTDFGDTVYQLLHADIYDRLRLMFFGNLHQDWSEFVLTDLGLLKYEAVDISAASRAFPQRADVDTYLHLWACRERLEAGEDPRAVLADIPGGNFIGSPLEEFSSRRPAGNSVERGSGVSPTTAPAANGGVGLGAPGIKPDLQEAPADSLRSCSPFTNPWLEERRGKLLFAIGQQLEREKDLGAALAVYQASSWPEARIRAIRVLEQSGQHADAYALAMALREASPREEEAQQLARILPRLRRKLGLKSPSALSAAKSGLGGSIGTLISPERRDLVLAPSAESVEWVVRAHLHSDHAPVFYVENALINSLFGLLCWPAIFAPVPGAFFHAFHYGPVDLHHPDFYARREQQFAHCLDRLESGAYREAILKTWQEKYGTASPFVFWEALDEELLTLALDCIPPAHLRALFTRLLADIKSNRSGFPDLIQFWPAEKRYLMLEVKGPGDRLQDNQIRWLDYCARHGIPVAVSHVTWAAANADVGMRNAS